MQVEFNSCHLNYCKNCSGIMVIPKALKRKKKRKTNLFPEENYYYSYKYCKTSLENLGARWICLRLDYVPNLEYVQFISLIFRNSIRRVPCIINVGDLNDLMYRR